MRRFNRSGPIVAEDHYHIPPLSRMNLDEIRELIADKQYFVLHAPRQTGKTTALLSLQRLLNEEGRYRCVYVNVEGAQAMRENVEQAVRMILGQTALQARLLGDDFLSDAWSGIWTEYGPGALSESLARWSLASDKPLVLLVDEIDSLVGDSLLAVLRQLRASHHLRPKGFPQCVVLCGVRDVRDYRIHSGSANTMIAGGSAFNIKSESLLLGDFSPEHVAALLQQHTEETGQPFSEDAVDAVWSQTLGQPWLVNALAHQACFRSDEGRGRADLLIVWPQGAGGRKFVVECKLRHEKRSRERTVAEGVEQTADYMDRCGAEAGHLVVFDRSEGLRWEEKVFRESRAAASGDEVHVWGM